MKRVFLILGVFVFLFILGCSDKTAIENPTANNSAGGTISTLGAGGVVGAVKVGSYNNGACGFNECDPRREDNTIAPGQTQLLWVNHASVNSCDSNNLFYKIFDGANEVVGFTPLGDPFTGCGEDYFGYLWEAPSADLFTKQSKIANLILYCENSLTIISGDSFRLVDNSSCVK